MTPSIEIVAIGTELLKGSVLNTNATEIAAALTAAGYACVRQSVLADEAAALAAGLKEALQRSVIVIATGGLGPTCDDITRRVAAELFHSEFRLNTSLAEELRRRYGVSNASVDEQASIPVKAVLLPNPIGSAAGLAFTEGTSTLILMPGVPKEMREMLHHQTLPYLKAKFPPLPPPPSLAAHFFGVSESMIDPSLRILEKAHPDIEFGIYPSHGTLKVSATYKPSARSMPAAQLVEVIEFLKQKFASHFYGLGDESLETLIYNKFTRSGWTLSTAESCTGGAIAARLTKVAGASNYFKGGVVSYSNELKETFLDVPKKVIDTFDAVSEETVRAMAEGVARKTGTDFSLAISGIAGPTGGTEEKPVGTMWIAVTNRKKGTEAHRIRGFGNREMVIETGVNVALGILLQFA